MMFGAGGAKGQQQAYDDSNKNSLISDIKNYFTKSVRPGAGLPSASGGQTSQILQQRDQEDIRNTLVRPPTLFKEFRTKSTIS